TGRTPKPSLQANGTVQLRVTRAAFVAFVRGLGVTAHRAADKTVPECAFEMPEPILTAFLRGLFDADGCVVDSPNGTRYVGLGSRSEELLLGVQELLASLGLAARIYQTGTKSDSFSYVRKDGSTATYGSDGPSFDLRISGRSAHEYAALIGFDVPRKSEKLRDALDRHRVYDVDETVTVVARESTGFETTYNLTEPRNHSYIVSGVVVANCSEYMHLDNSSCNLASLNLMKFLTDDDTFDAVTFARAVEFIITAMDISICFADFPTPAIGDTTRAYRQLGIGYANLGALLMATGHAYDSDGGRSLAAAITSLMTGTAYRRSAEIAGVVGAFDGYARNAEPHKRVMRKHAAANDAVRPVDADAVRVLHVATKAWQDCLSIGEKYGWRNAQASVLAPTGTIGLMMDCDTTGIEPDLALVKFKKLVGGGSMQIVNQTVPRALVKLGYQAEQVEAIVEYIAENGNVVDAPGLKPEHYEVFDCAMGERCISAMGHVRMMAATQPFISGAISKTVNMPESATVDEVADVYYQGWKLGLKALAIYRDNCKVGQPLSDAKGKKAEAPVEAAAGTEARLIRKRLPRQRPSQTVSFAVGGAEGYMTAGSYPDDGLGEVFLKLGKQGSTLAGVMDAFSIAISIALQYGVPLETYVQKFTNMRFEPAGLTDDPDIRMAQSVMDYIFRRLALDYLPLEKREELGIFTADERAASVAATSYGAAPAAPATEDIDVDLETLRDGVPLEHIEHVAAAAPTQARSSTELAEAMSGQSADAPLCMSCGVKMKRAGSCYVCESCGSTSGCS
ncbi:MAG TPA: vitamin B12-dependent ribonucleotide reductase, partial [Mycobacteriales bacterium]|nr:vitamin B12-dependent ribonucleotide reductase [Mycobacteriales bacterium]